MTTASPAPAAAAAGQVSLIQEPDAGYGPIRAAITAARASIDMTMYELVDPAAQADLSAAHRRGVAVRIIGNRAFHGQRANDEAYTQLPAAGVAVHWAPAGQIFHQKSITIVGAHTMIGTGNLTARYYPGTRDAWIDDCNPAQVHVIDATFTADWDSPRHSGPQVGAAGLVWSPGAGQQITAYLGTARRSVEFAGEELGDRHIVTALAGAAHRGVSCRIVMIVSADRAAVFTAVTRAGCTVRTYPDVTKAVYIHEKLILIDRPSMLIGSQNATSTSLNSNREPPSPSPRRHWSKQPRQRSAPTTAPPKPGRSDAMTQQPSMLTSTAGVEGCSGPVAIGAAMALLAGEKRCPPAIRAALGVVCVAATADSGP